MNIKGVLDMKNREHNQVYGEHLCLHDRQVLFQSLSQRVLGLMTRLEAEAMDLDLTDYFLKHYNELRKITNFMERDYPGLDKSTRDVDALYRRYHIRG
jgi:hypothetical protein